MNQDPTTVAPRVFRGIANEIPSNSSRHSKSKHNAIPRSKHFYFSTCKPFAIPLGKLALLLCWPFRVSFSFVIHSLLPYCICLMVCSHIQLCHPHSNIYILLNIHFGSKMRERYISSLSIWKYTNNIWINCVTNSKCVI